MIFERHHLVAGISKRILKGEIVDSFETVCRHKEGRSVDVSLTISAITDPQGRIVGVSKIMRDITERKRSEATQHRVEVLAASNLKLEAEITRRVAGQAALKQSEKELSESLANARRQQEELRLLTREVLSVQEEERKNISRELHDVIAQTLTGINIRLAALKKSATFDSADLERSISQTQKLVEHSVDIVHRFARELRPAVLDDLGLVPALHTYLKDFTARTGVRTHLTAFAGVEQLDTARRTVFFRVAQEALMNVSRHAHASRVEVTLKQLPDGFGLTIADDGKSFSVEKTMLANRGKRLGLLGMMERLEMVHGKFNVISAPGQGTTIEAQIPFSKKKGGKSKNNYEKNHRPARRRPHHCARRFPQDARTRRRP
jgi:signal transduction histidine kinase